MSDTCTCSTTAPTPAIAESADDYLYRFLAALLLIGMLILMRFFILLMTLLAGASLEPG